MYNYKEYILGMEDVGGGLREGIEGGKEGSDKCRVWSSEGREGGTEGGRRAI